MTAQPNREQTFDLGLHLVLLIGALGLAYHFDALL
jgi:hypothetical protein